MKPFSTRVCDLDGCNNKHHIKGLCKKHFARKERNGHYDITRRENNNGTLEEKFEKYCNRSDNGSCWLWSGLLFKQGYGRLVVNGKTVRAHRVSYLLHKGEIAKGLFVCHSCDTPACCNPTHLFLGTAADNNLDKKRKGRGAIGIRSGRAVLNDNDVYDIKKRLTAGDKQYILEKEYKVSKSIISRIATGKTWKHINIGE